MARLSVDLAPLFGLYKKETDLRKALVKHAMAVEFAGADGIVIGADDASGRTIKKAVSILSENLDISLTVRVGTDEQWIETLQEIKPSMAILPYASDDADMLGILVTKLQVENILVAFEIPPRIDLVKKAAKLKSDFLVFDCSSYCKAKPLGAQLEELNEIVKAAALGGRLSMGIIASGDFDNQRLSKLAGTKSMEEFFVGLPFFTDSLIRGYDKAIKSLKANIIGS